MRIDVLAGEGEPLASRIHGAPLSSFVRLQVRAGANDALRVDQVPAVDLAWETKLIVPGAPSILPLVRAALGASSISTPATASLNVE